MLLNVFTKMDYTESTDRNIQELNNFDSIKFNNKSNFENF